jgi:hypothetical protein
MSVFLHARAPVDKIRDSRIVRTDRMLPMVYDEVPHKATAEAKLDTLSRNFRESGIALVLDPFPTAK